MAYENVEIRIRDLDKRHSSPIRIFFRVSVSSTPFRLYYDTVAIWKDNVSFVEFMWNIKVKIYFYQVVLQEYRVAPDSS